MKQPCRIHGASMLCRYVLLLLIAPVVVPVEAQERVLSGVEIKELLSGNSALYDDGARQVFYQYGSTLYQPAGRAPDRGSWRVVADEYCSRWRGGGMTCYRVEYNDNNKRVTWNGEYPARMMDGDTFAQ